MLEFIYSLIKDIGIYGLLLGLAIEASSVPFPGALIVLTYGYVLEPSTLQVFLIALLAGTVYTAFSFIPYYIGYKLDGKMKKWFDRNKLEKSERWFNRCGSWTIALSRPLGLGNYISYFSGLSKVKPIRFGSITFIGITPWILVMLFVGRMGNLKSMSKLLSNAQQYILIGVALLVVSYLSYKIYKKRKNKVSPNEVSNNATKRHT